MSNYAISLKRSGLLLAAMAFTAALTLVNLAAFFSESASAAQLQFRSLTLSSSLEGDVGATETPSSELNGADATHTFTFDPATAGNIEAMQFLYCTTAIGACTAPTGLVVNAGTAITAQTYSEGTPVTNLYTVDASSTANMLRIDNATGTTFVAGTGGTVSITFDDITNPTSAGTFFVRIITYTQDTYTSPVDDGTVASAITEGISITSRVAETLGFSTTGAFAATAAGSGVDNPGANCSPLTGSGAITLGDPTEQTLSLTAAYDNYSAFRIYTNAANGVVVTYEGETLTKVPTADNIDEINGGTGAAAASAPGDEQFGLAVDMVSGGTAAVSTASRSGTIDLTYVSDTAGLAANGPLNIVAAYNDGNGTIVSAGTASFAFNGGAPVAIANSSSFVECKTAAIRYIANIDPLTSAGTYTTKIVYSAVPTY